MLSIHSARDPGHQRGRSRIGLAIAGGGPVGAMYELGVLRALEEACDGLDLTRLDGYVGVSSGAFFAAGLANRMDTAELCRIFLKGECSDADFRPEIFLQPAFREYLKRAAAIPEQGMRLLHDLVAPETGSRWSEALNRLGGLIPTGLFDNAPVEQFLSELFSRNGRSNDFRTLKRKLFVIAVDLDSSATTCFGGPDWEDVPISRAVQASSALPGLYPPVELRGRHFVDGALRRTMHASVLLDRGVDLLLGINPLVPFNPTHDARPNRFGDRRIAQGGLPGVLSQTLRTMLQSRMQVGLARYPERYPHIDQIVFEPNPIDRDLFYTNIFSFSARGRISQLGYRNTLDDLRNRREAFEPVLASHGIRLNDEVLADSGRSLLDALPPGVRRTPTTAQLARNLDDLEHSLRHGVV